MGEAPGGPGRGWTRRLVVLAVVLALIVVLVAENFVIIEVRLISRTVEVRLAWALLTAAMVGIITGLLLPRLWRRNQMPVARAASEVSRSETRPPDRTRTR